ncbi:MAG: murein biosynthesis integral membrane protein MurJ [Pseudomonadota bacterium]
MNGSVNGARLTCVSRINSTIHAGPLLATEAWLAYRGVMKLFNAFATVGSLTLVSRVLGFARDILIAAALGTGAVADAFFVAFRFPNLFRRLFGEGAFNAAFVPMYARKLEGDGEVEAARFASHAMGGLALVLIVLSASAMLAMPWLMVVLAPGFAEDPAKYDLTVTLTQIAFPYLLCLSLVALISGALNAHHKYWAAAAAPILLNIVLIIAITIAVLLGYGGVAGAGYILSVGVLFAGVGQLALLWIAMRAAGLRIQFGRPTFDADMRRLVKLGIPGLVAGGITQINIVVGTVIASLQAGAVSYLYYADRLYQLPLGIVGIAIGVVLLPELARQLRSGDQARVIDTQNRSLEFALLLTLPSAVGLSVAAYPIISVLFERGAFDATATPQTANALVAFAIGLPAFVLIKVFQPAFFAREDTATPMRYAFVNLVVNVIGSLCLFFGLSQVGISGHIGIALATSVAGWVNALLLCWRLSSDGSFAGDAQLLRATLAAIVGSAVMGAVLWFGLPLAEPWLISSQPIVLRALALLGVIGLAGALYFAIVFATGALRVSHFRRRTA